MGKPTGPRCWLSEVGTIRSHGWDVPSKLVDKSPKRLSTGSGVLRQDDRHPRILPFSNAHAGVDCRPFVLVNFGMLGLL